VIVLYGNANVTSPYVLSCFVALREKEASFEDRVVALERGEHYAPDFARSGLTSRVPVLVDGDLTLSESSAIVEYLEDALPPPGHRRVLPAGLRERARARQVMAWLRSDLMPIREQRSAEWVFYPHSEVPRFLPLDDAGRHAAAKLVHAAELLVPRDAGPMFGDWCVADTDLAMMLQRLIKCGDDVPARLRDFADRQWERPAVREFRDKRRPPFHGLSEYPKTLLV
jgi:glutathione S-transferase